MSQEPINVLLVPGLYPRSLQTVQHFVYHTIVPAWKKDGYRVTVWQFGWSDKQTFANQHKALLKKVSTLPGSIYGIGASAGGLAVINAWQEMPEKFKKVITIASPLFLTENDFASIKESPLVPIPKILLKTAYDRMDTFLHSLTSTQQDKIISVHGQHDSRVPPRWSKRTGIKTYELPVSGHGKTIMSALGRFRHKILA